MRAAGLALAALVGAWGLGAAAASAHPLAPALLELHELGGGEVAVTWKTPLSQAAGAPLEPELPAACVPASEPRPERDGSGLVLRWRIRCPGSLVGETLGAAGLPAARSDVLLRVVLADGRSVRAVLRPEAARFRVPARESALAVVGGYLRLGVLHIATGLDHLAFVLGLLLLVRGLRPLAAVISAFTLGHSVTLSLAALGYVAFPVRPVEVAIAGSIVALGVEVVRSEAHPTPGTPRRAPWLFASGFGLLHGLGFAGALADVGLPAEAIPLALFSFNVGIELGQLAFVAAAVLVAGAAARLAAPGPGWRTAAAYGIGTLGSFWMLGRMLGP